MVRISLIALVFSACGTRYGSPGGSFATVTVRVTASLSLPSSCRSDADIAAQLVIAELGITCPLQVTRNGASLTVSGDCPNVPTGGAQTLLLQYVTQRPNAADLVTLAESTGRADLVSVADMPLVDVVFDQSVPSLVAKTKGLDSDPAAERLRFNCDRDGTDHCVDGATSAGPDVDTCSNLQEHCAGTLFTAAINTCN
jgi:hypothetical protein